MAVADFSGYVTKANLKCSDGRTIMPEAFKHMDGMQVPLVWQHGHKEPGNVLGHALLEVRDDGVYGYGFFNDTNAGQNSKALVEHGDIKALSIFANQLVERSKQVFHGMIREVSLCLAGANPGAFIDNVTIAHADGSYEELEDAAIITFGLQLEHSDEQFDEDEIAHANQTVADVYNSLTPEQKDVVNYMIGAALESAGADSNAAHSDGEDNPGDNDAYNNEGDLEHQEGTHMNVFETQGAGGGQQGGTLQHSVSRDDVRSIVQAAIKSGSLKHAVEDYALAHGIDNLDILFPDAKTISNTPEFDKRRTEWVAGVLGSTSKTPFAKVKSITADITMESARALGYIKGNLKKEEFFSLASRVTGPTTIYKKQKLDRDDIVDIVDLDVVAWMKAEMRLMLEEEIARAILIGDGRPVEDPNNAGSPNPDKIKDPAAANSGDGLRSILNEHELYATTITAEIANDATAYQGLVEEIMLGMEYYKGTGTPTFYTTRRTLTKMLLSKDQMGRRLWRTPADLASEMGVDSIVPVEVMEGEAANGLVGIIVNLTDYNIGTNRGGEVTFFDDFDIDYNQLKYLGETRLSGALVKIKSAIIVRSVASGTTLVTPTAPTFVNSTGVVTIPTQTGTVYKNADSGATLTAGAQTALAVGATLNVHAVPASGSYYFESSEVDDWSFTRS